MSLVARFRNALQVFRGTSRGVATFVNPVEVLHETSADEQAHDDLIAIYRIAVEEYRFQVTLNWNRTQYFFVLNLGIIGLATGLRQLDIERGDVLTGALYGAGALCCFLSWLATLVQRGYYHTARDHKRDVEVALQLGPLSLSTTPGMGSLLKRRLGRVTTMNAVMFLALGAIDLVGVGLIIVSAVSPTIETSIAVP